VNPLTQSHGRVNMWRMGRPYREVLVRSVTGRVATVKDISNGYETDMPSMTPDGSTPTPGDVWLASVESGQWMFARMIDPASRRVTSLRERTVDGVGAMWRPFDSPSNAAPEVVHGAYLGERRYFEVPPNDRWIKLDGRAISRHRYRDYFDLVGTTFGVGDGSTTFNVDYVSVGSAGGILAFKAATTSTWTSSSTTTVTDLTVTVGDTPNISIALNPARRYKLVAELNFTVSIAGDRPVPIINIDGVDTYVVGIPSSNQGAGTVSIIEYFYTPPDTASHTFKLRGRLGGGGTGSTSLIISTGSPLYFYIEDTGPLVPSATSGWYVCVE